MPDELKLADKQDVNKFLALSPENVLQTRRRFLEHTVYDDLRTIQPRRRIMVSYGAYRDPVEFFSLTGHYISHHI